MRDGGSAAFRLNPSPILAAEEFLSVRRHSQWAGRAKASRRPARCLAVNHPLKTWTLDPCCSLTDESGSTAAHGDVNQGSDQKQPRNRGQ
jgi:hypothetical protein